MAAIVRASLVVAALLGALAVGASLVATADVDPRDVDPRDVERPSSAQATRGGARRRGAPRHRSAPATTTDAASARVDAPDAMPRGRFAATGRVVAQDGAPIEGAVVHLRGAGGRLDETMSAEDGSFRLGFNVSPCGESAVRCAAWTPRRAAAATPWMMTTAGRTLDVGSIVLADAELISGRVVDDSGAPVARASVGLCPIDSAAIEDWCGVALPLDRATRASDSDGRFEIWLPRGDYRMQISIHGQCDWRGADRVVAAGGPPIVVTLPPDRSPRVVQRVVRAVDERGEAVPQFRATLSAWDERDAASSEDGVASPRIVNSPPFRLVVSAPGREDVVIDDVETREDELVVTLRPAAPLVAPASIRGVVEDDGRPAVLSGELSAFAIDGAESGGGRTSGRYSNRRGRFSIDAPGAGACRVAFAGPARRGDDWIEVAGSATAWPGDVNVRIVVRPLASLVVEFVLEDGGPADEGVVTVIDERPGGAARSASFRDASAQVVVTEIAADALCRVEARARRGNEWLRGVVLRGVAPDGAPAVARFERGGVVAGVVVREDGTPVAAAVVANVADSPHDWSYWTDVEGRFRMTSLAGGFERLRASAPGLVQDGPDVLAESGGAPVRIVLVARKP